MALGINETIESQQYRSKHLVYREGVYVRYPNKDKEIVACILPALADPDDKSSYLPYRSEENPEDFTKWAVGLKMHPFVNKEQNIISPQSFERDAFDPIDELIRVAKLDPDYCLLAGFGKDGKKLQNAYKNPDVRLSSKWTGYIVNALVLFDREVNADKAVILQIPGTAFARGRSTRDESQTWGLLSELNRKNRKASKDDEDSYYWGDVTDPRNLIPCGLKITPNPAGGLSIYNMIPTDEDPVKINKAILETRYDLDKVFYEITEGEIIDRLIYYFGDVPKLLKRAFAHRVPNFDGLLKKATAAYSIPDNEDEDAEDEAVEAPKDIEPVNHRTVRHDEPEEEPQSAESSRSFAPDEDDLPPPVKKAKAAPVEDDDQEITVPRRKKAPQSEAKKVSMKDLMD